MASPQAQLQKCQMDLRMVQEALKNQRIVCDVWIEVVCFPCSFAKKTQVELNVLNHVDSHLHVQTSNVSQENCQVVIVNINAQAEDIYKYIYFNNHSYEGQHLLLPFIFY